MDHRVHFGSCLEAHNFIFVQDIGLKIGTPDIWLTVSESAVRIELGGMDQKLQASQNWIFVRHSIYMSHFDQPLWGPLLVKI